MIIRISYEVVFRSSAIRDLEEIEAFVATDSPERAAALIDRLQAQCRSLSTFPERSVRRDDLARGSRMLVFERRIIIIYRVEAATVLIQALVYGGRDLAAFWRETPRDDD